MNDIKKLIQMLKEYQKPYIGHDYIFYGIEFCNPQVQMCIEALEKQAPKNAMGKGSTKEVGYCPNCKSHLMYEPKTNYCRWCGQRLSWEVENEMSREVEFRGKDKYGNWIYGDLLQYSSGETAILNRFSRYGYEATEICNRRKVLPETIGQFTGLKDKNGKEVYEGDILEFTWEEDSCWGNEGTYKGFVRYCDGGYEVVYINRQEYTPIKDGGMHPNSKSDDLQSFIRWTNEINIEVIGNIHDNPELLEVDNE